MKVWTMKDKDEMSELASSLLYDSIQEKPDIVLGLATGGTPVGTYEKLVEKVKQNPLNLSRLKTVNLDEYVGLDPEHEESYWTYIHQHLYQPLSLYREQGIIPYGLSEDLEEECVRYEKAIKEIGGVDLQILGVGRNGHIGFNEPGTSFGSKTHLVDLTASTRQANARFFDDENEVPTRAITVGISTIMKSRSILLLVSGEEKTEAVSTLLKGKVDRQWPVTILNQHNDVTLIVTEDAQTSPKEERHA